MKLSSPTYHQMNKLSLNYRELFVEQKIGRFIYQSLPDPVAELIVICIGSDRSTGDALGPIVGSLLTKRSHSRFFVYGTLEKPIHALNLVSQLDYIKQKHKNRFIIAIDACLGRSQSIGKITASTGPLKPGLAMNKKLPEVGDLNITGIVNVSSSMGYLTLQNTRLHLVTQQAKVISRALSYSEYLLTESKQISQ